MRLTAARLVVLLLVTGLLPACSDGQTGLVGATWVLEQQHVEDALIPLEVTLEFKRGGEFNGFYSQLNYSGSYTIDGETLAIDDVCWLSLICQAEINMSGPQDFVETLQHADRFSLEGGTLTIYAGEDTLTFTPAA